MIYLRMCVCVHTHTPKQVNRKITCFDLVYNENIDKNRANWSGTFQESTIKY